MANRREWSLPRPPSALLGKAALFLDFDGTIVPIAEHADAIHVDESVHALLQRLHQRHEGRLSVISGRSVANIEQYLSGHHIVIAGSHGIEISWPDGGYMTFGASAPSRRLIEELSALKIQYPGVHIEEKPFGTAIHFRNSPRAEAACLQLAAEIAQREGLFLQPGKMVFELKALGANKGTAITSIMREPIMHGHAPIFIGDDETDEAGFAAVARLGGAGILVGEPRRTAAQYGLRDVADVHEWLNKASEA